MHKGVVAACVAILAAGHAGVMAAGAAGIVLDPTNLVQNTSTAVESIRQTATQIEQLQTQMRHYEQMLKNLKSMDGASLVGLAQGGFNSYEAINRALQAYGALGHSVEETRSIYDRRLDEARLMHMDWASYLQHEQVRIEERRDGAATRVQAEIEAFRRVEDDYRFARETASKIPATEGVHAAVQQTNAILNRIITQNAEVIRTLAQANGRQQAEQLLREEEERVRKLEEQRKVYDAQKRKKLDPAQVVDRFREVYTRGGPQ